jgi:HEAT repeat protein
MKYPAVVMRKLPYIMIFIFAASLLAAQPKEETISSDSLLSFVSSDDVLKQETAFKYIESKRPADLPDLAASLLLEQGDASSKKRILSVLQKYHHQQVVRIYLHLLEKSSSFMLKIQVIDILGKSNDKSVVVPVSKELESPFSSVRESAILALNEIGDDRMFPSIFKMAESKDPLYRVYALDALYHLYDLRLFSIVQQLLQDENKSVRLRALQCMEKNKLDKLLPIVRNIGLSDPDMEVRIEAVQILGKMNDDGGLYVILKDLTSDNRNLRLSSAKVLGKIKAKQSSYSISEQLAIETDNEIQIILTDSLIDMRDAGGFKGFEKKLSEETPISLKVRIVYGMGLIGGPKSLQVLLKALKDSDFRVRAESCNSLSFYKDRSVASVLTTVMKEDKERYVRLAALYSLERIRDKNVIIPMFDLYSVEKDPVFREKLFDITRLLIQYSI